MKYMYSLALAAVMASYAGLGSGQATAASDCEYWRMTFAGGTFQGIVTSGRKSSIVVTCGWGSMDIYEDNLGYVEDGIYVRASIEFAIEGATPSGNKIILKFDDESPREFEINDGEISNHRNTCPSCMKNYNKIIDLFTTHKQVKVTTQAGKSAVFTLRGADHNVPNCVYRLKDEAP